jgi:MFS transporter, SP family, arabinose:H+ symporter
VWITCGLVAQTFPWLRDNLGPAGTFWLYAALLSPSIIFAWKIIPETKGRTLEQIEKLWYSDEGQVSQKS